MYWTLIAFYWPHVNGENAQNENDLNPNGCKFSAAMQGGKSCSVASNTTSIKRWFGGLKKSLRTDAINHKTLKTAVTEKWFHNLFELKTLEIY